MTSALSWGDAPFVKLCVKEGVLRTVTKEHVYVSWGQGQRRNEECFLKVGFFLNFLIRPYTMFLHNRNPEIKFQSRGHGKLIQQLCPRKEHLNYTSGRIAAFQPQQWSPKSN